MRIRIIFSFLLPSRSGSSIVLPRGSVGKSVLKIVAGEQHGAPDLGAAARAGPGAGEGDDGQDGHLVPLRQPDGAAHREQGRGDPHLLGRYRVTPALYLYLDYGSGSDGDSFPGFMRKIVGSRSGSFAV